MTMKGKKHSRETKEKMKLSVSKKSLNAMTGHKVSDQTKEKIAESRRGDKHWTTRLPYTEEHKAKLREKRLHQVFPLKDTKIEVKMQNVLKSHGIKFKTHVPLKGQPDIYIDVKDGLFHKGLCIFVDGCYWHGCMECYPDNYDDKIPSIQRMRDPTVDEFLKVQGYYVMRIPEHIILSDDKFGEKTDMIENYIDIIKLIIGMPNNFLKNEDSS